MENSLLHNVYNPDVLSCIANLSKSEQRRSVYPSRIG